MSTTTSTEPSAAAQAVIAQLAVVGPKFGSRPEARSVARDAGFRTFHYGKRRHVAVAPDGRLFYLGGPEDDAQWVAMEEITSAPPVETEG